MAEYRYDSNEKLTEHFTVREFRCKCGAAHTTHIDPALPRKLEELRSRLGCKAIVINSGYRCPAHDKSVGGSGSGPHTKGIAADIVCYGKDGRAVSSNIVSCAAQNLGFGGIANIDKSRTATHVDVRTENLWKGDETVTTAYSVTGDFYSYYGLTKAAVYGAGECQVTVKIGDTTYTGTLTEKS